jgi:hypothetical protein
MHKAFRKAIRESQDQVEVEDSDHDVPSRPPAPVFHAKPVSVGRKKSRGRPRKISPYVAVPEVPENEKLKPEIGKPKAKKRGRPKRKHSSSSSEEEAPLYILPCLSFPSLSCPPYAFPHPLSSCISLFFHLASLALRRGWKIEK